MDPVQESEDHQMDTSAGPDQPDDSRPLEGGQPPPWRFDCPDCGGPLTVLFDKKLQPSSSNQDDSNKMKQKNNEKHITASAVSSNQPAGDWRIPSPVPGQPENDSPSSNKERTAGCQRSEQTSAIFIMLSLDQKVDKNQPSMSSQGRKEQTKQRPDVTGKTLPEDNSPSTAKGSSMDSVQESEDHQMDTSEGPHQRDDSRLPEDEQPPPWRFDCPECRGPLTVLVDKKLQPSSSNQDDSSKMKQKNNEKPFTQREFSSNQPAGDSPSSEDHYPARCQSCGKTSAIFIKLSLDQKVDKNQPSMSSQGRKEKTKPRPGVKTPEDNSPSAARGSSVDQVQRSEDQQMDTSAGPHQPKLSRDDSRPLEGEHPPPWRFDCPECRRSLTPLFEKKVDHEDQPSSSNKDRMGKINLNQKKRNEGLQSDYRSLKSQKSKPKVKVGYIITGETFGAAEIIMKQVKSNSLSMKKINMKNIQEYDIIIIFCSVSSRVGSDVDAAMRSVSVSENQQVFLVVMHHTRDVDYSTEGRKWSEEYRIKKQFNVLFHETQPGLLRCPQNQKEIYTLKDQLDGIRHSEGSSNHPEGDYRDTPPVPGQPEHDSRPPPWRFDCPGCGESFILFKNKKVDHEDQPSTKTNLIRKKENEKATKVSHQGLQSDQRSLKSQKSKPKVNVGYIITGQTFGAAETIMEQVKSNSLSIKKIDMTNIQEYDIIIIFCPVSSRVGSDVDAAMRSVSVSENQQVFLVVMHHTRDVDYSVEGRKWSEEYRIKKQFNVLFHETQPGLLRCPQNEKEIKALKNQLPVEETSPEAGMFSRLSRLFYQ